jgi:hypothetical protein
MRLTFQLPPGFREVVRGREVTVVADGEPGLVIQAFPLVRIERFDPTEVIRRGKGRVAIVEEHAGLTTETGWPMQLFRAERCDDAGALVEVRLAAAYVMAYYGGVAVARLEPALAETLRQPLLQLLASARPIFRAPEPLTVAELFELTVTSGRG